VEPNKSQKKNAANLARDLVTKTSDTLEPYIQQVIDQLLNKKLIWESVNVNVGLKSSFCILHILELRLE